MQGNIIRNKTRLVAQDYNQKKGIDTFALVTKLEAIRLLLAFAYFMNFKLCLMDVQSSFLNEYIEEEVYIEQPQDFKCHEFFDHVFQLNKAFYGLK